LGMQLGYTKYCCFICEWNSHANDSHDTKKDWPLHKHLVSGQESVAHKPLVDPTKIFLSSLHIKLGLMQNFVKAMNKNVEDFNISTLFLRVSDAKNKFSLPYI
uniref:Uncharacterized protein n=1 Tax=Lepisosteus oculatus TaxID=7918 RepID=W5MRV1_LEPOC